MANKQISKVTLGGITYDIKDEAARARLTALEGIATGGVSIKVVEELPTPGDDTLGIIYFKKKNPEGKEGDVFDEYLTVKVTEGSHGVAKWEHIGSTSVDLSEYAKKAHHHKIEMEITHPKYTGTPRGTISLPTVESTVNKTVIQNVAQILREGIPYALNGGSVNKDMDVRQFFAREAIRAEYMDSTETLVFEEAPSAEAVTGCGETHVTFPTLTGALPAFEKVTPLYSVSISNTYNGTAQFEGEEETLTPTKAKEVITGVTKYGALDGEGIFISSENHL